MFKNSLIAPLVAQVYYLTATQDGRLRLQIGAKLIRAGTSSRQLTLSRIEYPAMGCNVELVRCSLAIKGELSSSRRMSRGELPLLEFLSKMSKVSCPKSHPAL